jgi:hypothetical protein
MSTSENTNFDSISNTPPATNTSPATTLANAAQSVNITSLVTIRLDMLSNAYRLWQRLFHVILGRFNLRHHIDGTPPRLADPLWIQEDLTVLMWINATLADDLLDMVMDDDISACEARNRIATFFLGNRASHAVQLEQDLHNLEQRDMSVAAFCHRLKTLADSLADCDRPIDDRSLVHQLIRGMNPKFHVLKKMLPALPSFPTFMEARDQLIVAKNTLASSKSPSTKSALNITDSSYENTNHGSSNNHYSRSDGGQGNSGYSRSRGGGRYGSGRGNYQRGRGRGRGRGYPPQNPAALLQQLASWYASGNTWRAPWTGNTGPGVLGARPPMPQAYNAFIPPTTQMPPAAPPSFDTMTLLQALHNASQSQQQHQNDWFLDTGASGHMTSDTCNFTHYCPSVHDNFCIIIGNGSTLSVLGCGSTTIHNSNHSFHLSNVLHTPNLIKNLISVRKFTKDNACSIEFDPLGFSIKDLHSRKEILRSSSRGDLYPFHSDRPSHTPVALHISTDTNLWHQRLGHPRHQKLDRVLSIFSVPRINKSCHVCDAC